MFEYGQTFVKDNQETLERLKDLMGEDRFNAARILAPLIDADEIDDEEVAAEA